MDNSTDPSREYLPVHPDLKLYTIQEFYSVPENYLVFLEQDMQVHGGIIKYLKTIQCDTAESESVLLRMETRTERIWNRYINYLREGAAQSRILQLREINRKAWYCINLLTTMLTLQRSLSDKVYYRRMEFLLSEIDDVADSINRETGVAFDLWQRRLIMRLHKII